MIFSKNWISKKRLKNINKELKDNLEEALKKNDKLEKIISNKEFKYLGEYSKANDENIRLSKLVEDKGKKIVELNKCFDAAGKTINELSRQIKSLRGTKGGLKKEINKIKAREDSLISEIKEKDNIIKDLKSDRYLRVNTKTVNRKRKTQIMGIKSGIKNGEIMGRIITK